jgi:hypothetical protein
MKSITLLIFMAALLGNTYPQTEVVGNTSFVHLEKINDIWWLVDATNRHYSCRTGEAME